MIDASREVIFSSGGTVVARFGVALISTELATSASNCASVGRGELEWAGELIVTSAANINVIAMSVRRCATARSKKIEGVGDRSTIYRNYSAQAEQIRRHCVRQKQILFSYSHIRRVMGPGAPVGAVLMKE